MASDAPSPHAGHRARLRQRLLEAPADLSEAEILELLLSYAIPRRDVAPLADSLGRWVETGSARIRSNCRQC